MKSTLLAIFCTAISFNTYAGHDQIVSALYQNWVSGKWQDHQLNVYAYNGLGQMITDNIHNWDAPDHIWQNSFTYDCDGSVSTQTFQSLNTTTGTWENVSMYSYTYDANGKEVSAQYQVCISGEWTNQRLVTNTYDEKGQLTSYFSGNENGLGHNTRLSYDINPDGSVNTKTVRTKHSEGEEYISSVISYTYNSGVLMSTTVKSCWSGDCKNETFDTYVYDESGALTADTTKEWNDAEKAWVNSVLTTYTKYSTLTQIWDNTNDSWINSTLATYTYETSCISQVPSLVSAVYPNPATDIINVTMENLNQSFDISLTDMTGKEIWSKTGNTTNQEIDISNLTDGIYLLNVYQSGQTTTRKITKQ